MAGSTAHYRFVLHEFIHSFTARSQHSARLCAQLRVRSKTGPASLPNPACTETDRRTLGPLQSAAKNRSWASKQRSYLTTTHPTIGSRTLRGDQTGRESDWRGKRIKGRNRPRLTEKYQPGSPIGGGARARRLWRRSNSAPAPRWVAATRGGGGGGWGGDATVRERGRDGFG